jgi:hypothetical protein
MELITLCGLAIVFFGFWIELEPIVRRILNSVSRIRVRGTAKPLIHGHKSGLA